MIINKPKVRIENEIEISSYIEFDDGNSFNLSFYVDLSYKKEIEGNENLTNSFLICLLPTAMLIGEDIRVEDSVSKRLYYSIIDTIQPILNQFKKEYKIVKISAPLKCANKGKPNKKAATGFSAGVDSFFTIQKHWNNDDCYKSVEALVVANVYNKRQSAMFEDYVNILRKSSKELGLPLIEIRSNLANHLKSDYYSSHTLITLGAIMLLSNVIDTYYYSSTYSLSDSISYMYKGTDDIGAYDAKLVPALSTDDISFIPCGTGVTRMDKVRSIIKFPASYSNLNVCMSPNDINCGVCGKCTRTIMALYCTGKLERYKNVFDVEKWERSKRKHIIMALISPSPFMKDIVNYADRENIELAPKSVRFITNILRRILDIFPYKKVSKLSYIYRGKLRS